MTELFIFDYPKWLRNLHEKALRDRTAEGKPVATEDISRLRTFVESRHGSFIEKL